MKTNELEEDIFFFFIDKLKKNSFTSLIISSYRKTCYQFHTANFLQNMNS